MWNDSSKNDLGMGISPIATHYSPPLRKVIYWLNQKSINLYAEQLLLAMADSLKSDDPPSMLPNFWKTRASTRIHSTFSTAAASPQPTA